MSPRPLKLDIPGFKIFRWHALTTMARCKGRRCSDNDDKAQVAFLSSSLEA
ncbi:MAG: hypothetical protein RRE21_00910 [Desulfurococcales archaeon]|nr:hypothetical protein [Desulfurococcales archaeon]